MGTRLVLSAVPVPPMHEAPLCSLRARSQRQNFSIRRGAAPATQGDVLAVGSGGQTRSLAGGTASDYARGNATVQLLQFHLGSAWQTAAHGDGKTAETEDMIAFLPRVCVCRPSRGHGGSQWTRREDDSVW
jgi:hypothetical protein